MSKKTSRQTYTHQLGCVESGVVQRELIVSSHPEVNRTHGNVDLDVLGDIKNEPFIGSDKQIIEVRRGVCFHVTIRLVGGDISGVHAALDPVLHGESASLVHRLAVRIAKDNLVVLIILIITTI